GAAGISHHLCLHGQKNTTPENTTKLYADVKQAAKLFPTYGSAEPRNQSPVFFIYFIFIIIIFFSVYIRRAINSCRYMLPLGSKRLCEGLYLILCVCVCVCVL